MNHWNLIIFLYIIFKLVLISKSSTKFKKCNDNIFCKRYLNYINFLAEYNESIKDNHSRKKYIWSIDPNSILFFEDCDKEINIHNSCSTISFEIYNTYYKKISPLKCKVFIYSLGILRIKIYEKEYISNFRRYEVGQDVIFQNDHVFDFLIKKNNSSIKIDLNEESLYFSVLKINNIFDNKNNLCEYKVKINFSPFIIKSYFCDKEILTINGKQFFNFERSGRVYPKFNRKMNNLTNDNFFARSMKDFYLEKENNHYIKFNIVKLIFLKLRYFKKIFIRILNIFFSRKTRIEDIVDAVDVYNLKIWAEKFENFIDFKYNGPTAIGVDIQIHSCNDIYGFSEKTSSLNLNDFEEPYRFYNVDTFKYKLNVTDAMYGSTPLLISLSDFDEENQDNYQVLYSSIIWANPSDTYAKIKKNNGFDGKKYVDSWWVSETGIMDFTTFISSDIEHFYYLMHTITGFPLFAPRFSFGFHYSKWEHTGEKRVLEIQNFLEGFKVPYDSIWLDIEHTEKKGYFTWDKTKFPNINKLIRDLNLEGKYLVIISDPHFRIDNKYYVYSFFEKLKTCDSKFIIISLNYKKMIKYLFNQFILPTKFVNIKCKFQKIDKLYFNRIAYFSIKSPWVQVPFLDKPRDFVGECWPGQSKYLDIFSPIIQKYLSIYFEKLFRVHQNIGYWVDMNEPSIFNTPELTFPKQVVYQNGFEDREVHSLYSFYHVRSVFSGLVEKFNSIRRPFILSRSFWLGSNRYSLVWTGDTVSNWNYYYSTITTNVRNALCGFSFTGSDVGGYEGHPEDLLFLRWHQIGIWFPLYRQHGSINSISRDYIFRNPEIASIITKYIRLRYFLIPFWYTLLAFYVFYGKPMIKPLFWLNPKNKEIRSIDNAFLVGDSFMITQVNRSGYTLIKLVSYLGNFRYKKYYSNIEAFNNKEKYNIWYNLHLNYIYIDKNLQLFNSQNVKYTPDLIKGGTIIPFSSNSNIYSSKDQLKYPTDLVVYLTGKLSLSFKLRNQVLFSKNNNFLLNEPLECCYNDLIIDPITIHSEGSIFLDDGETYSFLDNKYIFDDIIFKVMIKENKNNYFPVLDFLDNSLFSALNLDYQAEKLANFKKYFEYVLYLNPRKAKIKPSHIPPKFKKENLEEIKTNDRKLFNNKINKIRIKGLPMKPKKIFALIESKDNLYQNYLINLNYNVTNLNFTDISNINLYIIDISIDSELLHFGNYEWKIKINF